MTVVSWTVNCFSGGAVSAGGRVSSRSASGRFAINSGRARWRRLSDSSGFDGVSVGAACGATLNTISGGSVRARLIEIWGNTDSDRSGTLIASVTWRVTAGVGESSSDCSSSTFSYDSRPSSCDWCWLSSARSVEASQSWTTSASTSTTTSSFHMNSASNTTP